MTIPVTSILATPPRELTAVELDRAGLLHAERNVDISRFAIFVPADAQGTLRPITIRAGAVIGAFAVVHGGTTVGEQAQIEEHAVVAKPELGYAVGRFYPGTSDATLIGADTVMRSGAIVYASVHLGVNTLVGHHTLLRTSVQVGAETQLGHHLTVERTTRIGRDVRCSPGSHITSSTQIADRVFLGAGIRTINDKTLTWRDPNRTPTLAAPRFDTCAKVGSGSTVLAGVTIGEHASSAPARWSRATSRPGPWPTVTQRACMARPGDQRGDHHLAAAPPTNSRPRSTGRLAPAGGLGGRLGCGAHRASDRRGPASRGRAFQSAAADPAGAGRAWTR
ncbi:MAG: hypothetical protein ACRDTH_18930 [Pseudonocardiaceae bacterium]